MRFFLTVDPAITRKRTFGTRHQERCEAGHRVDRALWGLDIPMYDITTGTGDFIANGVVSHNCFARPTHTYLDLDAGPGLRAGDRRQGQRARGAAQRAVAALLETEHVALGTNTDPYQWVESRYRLMPGIWEAIEGLRHAGSLVTKSPLVLRDIELLQELNERSEMTVYLSVPTLDEKAWRETEPHTPSPARLEAVGKLNQSGVPAGILVAPLIPGVNDSPEEGQGDHGPRGAQRSCKRRFRDAPPAR